MSTRDTTKYEKDIKNGILEIRLESWKDFSEIVIDSKLCPPTCIFRGQANSQWSVTSTLDRKEEQFSTKPNKTSACLKEFHIPRVERELHLNRFKEMVRGKIINPPADNDENEWWSLAQHHGLATPMLDWTYSPFIALFFAFDCNDGGDERAVFVLAHHLVREKELDDKPAPHPFSPKGYANYRIVNQGGVFLKMPKPEYEDEAGKLYLLKRHIDLEAYVKDNFAADTYNGTEAKNPRAILLKITIPTEGRIECLKYLDHMNINQCSLFPDLDGAARYVNDLWEINFDKSIGHINQ